MSAIATGATVITAQAEKWDPLRYGEQRRKEEQLQSAFSLGIKGSEKMIAQPTKLQNRKHQINSLVYKAAEVEFELMEMKGARNKTKSETQAKYGW